MGICNSITQRNKLKDKNYESYSLLLSKNRIFTINKSLCRVAIQSKKDESNGIGFFMNIKNNMKCLITNYQNITQNFIDSKRNIIIQLENDKETVIKLDKKKRFIKYLKSPYNISIIEIFNSDLLNNDVYFLDYDSDLDSIDNYDKYLNKKILSLEKALNEKDFLFGEITNLSKLGFEYSIDINNCKNNNNHLYSGAPIILLDNQKLIGINENENNNINYGIFISEILKKIKEDINEEKEEENEKEKEEFNKINGNEKPLLEKQKNESLTKFNNQEILIKYLINDEKKIKLFGSKFIENNKKRCKIIINDEEKEICQYLDIQENIITKDTNILQIKLKLFRYIEDISYMFENCENLFSIENIYELNTSKIKNLNNLFFGCSSLSFIPDISNWDTSNAINMGDIFSGCSMITSLPDISKWNTSRVKNMSYMFSGCELLSYLPDISKWDTSKVKNFSYMFNWCKSLSFLPEISKWDTSNIIDMSWMFSECSALEKIPNLSKWKTNNVIDMNHMFFRCSSLLSFPGICFWNTNKVKDMSFRFYGCGKVEKFPDISNWNTDNLENTKYMFQGCKNYWRIKFKLVN